MEDGIVFFAKLSNSMYVKHITDLIVSMHQRYKTFLFAVCQQSFKILQIDMATRAVTPWKELMPGNATGIVRVPNVDLSADGRSYVYTYSQRLSELYLAEGLR